jgi:hypothetical protein
MDSLASQRVRAVAVGIFHVCCNSQIKQQMGEVMAGSMADERLQTILADTHV